MKNKTIVLISLLANPCFNIVCMENQNISHYSVLSQDTLPTTENPKKSSINVFNDTQIESILVMIEKLRELNELEELEKIKKQQLDEINKKDLNKEPSTLQRICLEYGEKIKYYNTGQFLNEISKIGNLMRQLQQAEEILSQSKKNIEAFSLNGNSLEMDKCTKQQEEINKQIKSLINAIAYTTSNSLNNNNNNE